MRVHIGGYGSRFTDVGGDDEPRTRDFTAPGWPTTHPAMILIHLDGAGPLGDPYQVDSANHGPYGAAVTRELIPMIEEKFRGIGQGHARVVDGGSTGGWVALALQVFYPEFFNGAWAFCPDSVDFRSFQLVNIYEDDNAYINRHGFERPAARDVSGEVRYTMRHECQLENVLGRRRLVGALRRPVGRLERDLRAQRRRRPAGSPLGPGHRRDRPQGRRALEDLRPPPPPRGELARARPQAQGEAAHLGRRGRRLLPQQRRAPARRVPVAAQPPYEGSITYGPGQGHCWMGISQTAMMKQMAQRMAAPPAAVEPASPLERVNPPCSGFHADRRSQAARCRVRRGYSGARAPRPVVR